MLWFKKKSCCSEKPQKLPKISKDKKPYYVFQGNTIIDLGRLCFATRKGLKNETFIGVAPASEEVFDLIEDIHFDCSGEENPANVRDLAERARKLSGKLCSISTAYAARISDTWAIMHERLLARALELEWIEAQKQEKKETQNVKISQ